MPNSDKEPVMSGTRMILIFMLVSGFQSIKRWLSPPRIVFQAEVIIFSAPWDRPFQCVSINLVQFKTEKKFKP